MDQRLPKLTVQRFHRLTDGGACDKIAASRLGKRAVRKGVMKIFQMDKIEHTFSGKRRRSATTIPSCQHR